MSLKTETVEFGRIEDMLAEAHAIGYRRGVQDAAKSVRKKMEAENDAAKWHALDGAQDAILALLEQTSDTNSPHPEIGAGRSAKRE